MDNIKRKLKMLAGSLYNDDDRFKLMNRFHMYDNLSDAEYLKRQYKAIIGKELDLEHPRTFNEKLQWLKLYNRRLEYTMMVDKYSVKDHVAKIIGAQYVIPTLGIWDSIDDVDLNTLPDKFVLKATHDSGSVFFCKDKNNFDFNTAKKVLGNALKKNFFYVGREWPYLHVKPRIIAEKFLVDESGSQLKDYKVFTFSGNPYCIQVDYDRFTNHKRNFYDTSWKYLPFTTCYPTDKNHIVEKPLCLKELLEKATKIAQAIPCNYHVRIDFYITKEHIYFGEITFYHGSGFEKFMPEEWDAILGNMIKLDDILV